MNEIRFDDVQVDRDSFRVRKAGAPLPLEPKSIRVLLHLIDHRDRVVPKEELIEAIWKDTFVTDNALTRTVAQLRKALGDDVRQARYIETVPTIGYRFIAPVNQPEPAPARRNRWPAIAGAALAVAALAIAVVRARTPTSHLPESPAVQLTASVGLDAYPAFSPDGASLAYSSDRSGAMEIYVRPATPGGREIRITEDGGLNIQPAWSPDGRLLAYHSMTRGGVYVVPSLGGFPRQISLFGSKPAWSPDGRLLAFQSDNAYSLVGLDSAPVTPSAIWVAPAAGGEPRQITRNGRHSSPVWMPDGKRLLFLSHAGFSEAGLWSVDLNGDQLRKIADAGIYAPALTPDGKSLYYAEQMKAADFRILRLDLAGGKSEEIVRTGLAMPRDLAASKQKLAYSLASITSNLWSLPLDGGAPTPITQDTSYRNTHPAFSPDGRRIAWFVRRLGVAGDVWIADSDGRNAFPLTIDPKRESFPVWTPDGAGIIYASREDGAYRLWVTTLAGGATRPYSPPARMSGLPNLLPSLRRVAYHRTQNGVHNVWTASLDGGDPVQLTFDKESAGFPSWSPDGKWLALEVARGSSSHLAVMPSAGGPLQQITNETGHSWPFGWSPDGARIAYAALRDGAWNLQWVSRATGERRKLTAYPPGPSFVRYPAWSPAGDRLIYERVETRGNIYLREFQ